MPTMDAVHRFMKSNPLTAMEMLTEISPAALADTCSDARLRELWMEHHGGFNKRREHFFCERDLMPALLRRIIDSVARAALTREQK